MLTISNLSKLPHSGNPQTIAILHGKNTEEESLGRRKINEDNV